MGASRTVGWAIPYYARSVANTTFCHLSKNSKQKHHISRGTWLFLGTFTITGCCLLAGSSFAPAAPQTDENVRSIQSRGVLVADGDSDVAAKGDGLLVVDDEQSALAPRHVEAFAPMEHVWLATGDLRSSMGGGASRAGALVEPAAFSYLDNSPGTLDVLYSLAAQGAPEALSAFVILGPGSPSYRERSLELLYVHAANGSSFALSTLAEWSATGFGFATRDVASSIAFEYVAWSTAQWGADEFAPTAELKWTTEQCFRGIAEGRAFSVGKPWAKRLTPADHPDLCLSHSG